MEYNNVMVTIMWDELFRETGIEDDPFSKKFDIKKGALDKTKKDLNMETSEVKRIASRINAYSSMTISKNYRRKNEFLSNYEVSAGGINIALTTKPKMSVFEFMGMKVDSDMSVVVEGNSTNVVLVDICNGFISYLESFGGDKSDLASILSHDDIKRVIEKIKFGSFEPEDLFDDSFYGIEVAEGGPNFKSVTINFLKGDEGLFSVDAGMYNQFKKSFTIYMSFVVDAYTKLKMLLGILEDLYRVVGAIVGREEALKRSAGSSSPKSAVVELGDFRGFKTSDSIIDGIEKTGIWESFLLDVKDMKNDGIMTKDLLMNGMVGNVDGSEVLGDEGMLTSLSFMDYMKYRDDDISFAGLDPVEDRDFMLENIDVIYRQGFRDIIPPEMVEAVGKMVVGEPDVGIEIPGMDVIDVTDIKVDTELPEDAPDFAVMLRGLMRSGRIAQALLGRIVEIH